MRVVDGGTVEIIPAAYGIMEVRLIGGDFLQSHTFASSDFALGANSACRLHSQISVRSLS
jgi:hypothetical protein